MSFYKKHAPNHREHARSLPDLSEYEGMKYQGDEAALPSAYYEKENNRIKELGLEPVDSIQDKTEISCFQRGSSPHWSGINTFLKTPYLEDVRKVGEYDVAFVGVPFDIGTTYRAGTRFGPQGIRRISSLYPTYNFEHGRGSARVAQHVRRRRHLLPGQHHQEPRPDHERRRAHSVAGHAADDHGRRSLDRLSHRPRRGSVRGRQGRHHPPRPARRHAGKGHGRDHAHLPVVPRDQHSELPADRTWCSWGSVAGRCRGRA